MRTGPVHSSRSAALSAVGVAVLLLAGPAYADKDGNGRKDRTKSTSEQGDAGDNRHPSGRDRSVESGGSGTQGRSQSDPDGMSNGGADKPGGTGGIDLDDQDGNNGCGNDDDFEDDNNGNCGGRAPQGRAGADRDGVSDRDRDRLCDGDDETGADTPVVVPGVDVGGSGDMQPGGVVVGGTAGRAGGAGTGGAGTTGGAQVLGVRLDRGVPGSAQVGGAQVGGATQSLPFTGGPIVPLALAGLATVAAGGAMLARGRR